MCRGKSGTEYCSELGADPALWSRRSPLPKPPAFDQYLDGFVDACIAARDGDLDSSLKLLATIPDTELREWYVEHAQNTGAFRFKGMGRPDLTMVTDQLDPSKDFSSLTDSIYDRDALHCRYCESRVLPKAVFELLSRRVPTFTLGRSNEARPGIYLVYCATLDHVVPHAAGGRTDAENLVISCWPCNYGKFKYSLEQLGLDSPFECEPIKDREWVSLAASLATP